MLRVLMLSLAIVTLAACGGDDGPAPEPTKENAVATLRSLEAAVSAGDLDTALTLVTYKGITKKQVRSVMKREGLTPASIDLLAAKGTFGPLTDVFPRQAASLSKDAGVDPAKCYGLRAGEGETGLHWDGQAFSVMHIDNLDRLR